MEWGESIALPQEDDDNIAMFVIYKSREKSRFLTVCLASLNIETTADVHVEMQKQASAVLL